MRYVGPRQIVIDDNPADVSFWEPDRSYEGQSVVLVGGGPSHAGCADLLRGHRFIAINSSARAVRSIATPADMLYFTDNSWAEYHEDLIRDWPGPVVCSNRHAKARLGDLVRRIDPLALTEWIGVPSDFTMASSGHLAACLALRMGAARLVLIGFECQVVDGRSHGHSDYHQRNDEVFEERFMPGWHYLGPALLRRANVINATPQSAIRQFRHMPLEQALRWQVFRVGGTLRIDGSDYTIEGTP